MYNRYIPQPDGSYQRSRQPDKAKSPPPRMQEQRPQERPPERRPQDHKPPCQQHTPPPVCPPPSPRPVCRDRRPEPPAQPPVGIGKFLKNLLPRDFDTEDLLIILMFLLMSRDCKEDQNSALLTLALYLFM